MGITEVNVRKQFERARKRVQNMIGGIQHDEFKEPQRNIWTCWKIALDDFDKLEEQHEFSHTYTRKKKLFMEEMKLKDEKPQKKRKNIVC